MKQKLLFYCLLLFVFNKTICQIPSGEVLWLIAAQNVTVDANNKISEWKDNSGNNNNVTQSNPLQQPTLVNNVLGKRPAVFFDGINGKYFLSNNSSNLTTAGSARTVFIVGLLDSLATANGGGDFPSAGGTMFTFRRTAPVFSLQTARIHNSNAPNADYIYTAGLGTNSNVSATDEAYYNRSKKCEFIDAFISSGAGTYLKVKQDGKNVSVMQTNATVSDYGDDGFTVGDREDFSGQNWQGYIAEIIVYNRELTSQEILRTEAYLSCKYHYCITSSGDGSNLNITNEFKRNIILYPNPVNNILTIDGLPQTKKVSLSITDLTGTIQSKVELNNSSKYIWDVSKIKPGDYILYIRFNGNTIIKKFVKE